MDLSQLRAEVDRRFQTREDPAAEWEDPHASGPGDAEEDGRLSNTDRYRIAGQRVHAWVQVLQEAGLAQLRTARLPKWAGGIYSGNGRAAILSPERLGSLPLTVVLFSHDDGEDNALAIGVGGGEPEEVGLFPDCPCDACDAGSAALLAEIDDVFSDVVGGTFAHVRGGKGGSAWVVQSTLGSAWGKNLSTRRVGDLEETLERVRAGENLGDRALHGAAWF